MKPGEGTPERVRLNERLGCTSSSRTVSYLIPERSLFVKKALTA